MRARWGSKTRGGSMDAERVCHTADRARGPRLPPSETELGALETVAHRPLPSFVRVGSEKRLFSCAHMARSGMRGRLVCGARAHAA